MYQQTYWRHEGLQLLKAYIPTIITNCFYKQSMKVTHGFYGPGVLESIFEWH